LRILNEAPTKTLGQKTFLRCLLAYIGPYIRNLNESGMEVFLRENDLR
jgi:hypothetical protein